MNVNTEITHSRENITILKRLLKNEKAKLRQLKFNRKMRDRRRK